MFVITERVSLHGFSITNKNHAGIFNEGPMAVPQGEEPMLQSSCPFLTLSFLMAPEKGLC